MNLLKSVLGSLVIFFMLASPATAQDEALERTDVEKIVHEYLVKNPEIIVEALQVLQERQQTAAVLPTLRRYKTWLEDEKMAYSIGNPDGDITIVEFFDFRCGYCKRHFPVLQQLAERNPDLKIIFKQYPILDRPNTEALSRQSALAAMFASSKGKGAEFHEAMMSTTGSVTAQAIRDNIRKVGLDVFEMDKAVKTVAVTSALDSSLYVGREMRFDATPSYIVGEQVFTGGVGEDRLQRAIEQARSRQTSP